MYHTGVARLAACTIVARKDLAQARVLIESFFAHEPEGHFYLLVVDDLPADEAIDTRVHVVRPAELPTHEYMALCFEYTVIELCGAVKPLLLQRLLTHYGERRALFFDFDNYIYNPLDVIRHALATSTIVLTPHVTSPAPPCQTTWADENLLRVGVYNLGFLGVSASDETLRFLTWWGQRLRDGCRVDMSRGLYLDQKWLDLAPSLFTDVRVLRDPSYNVAYWNWYERRLTAEGSRTLVNGQPLVFFHFSGYDPLQRAFRHDIALQEEDVVLALANHYADRCLIHGHERLSTTPYRYATFDNGIPIDAATRHLYRSLDAPTRRAFGNLFETASPTTFFRWATTPQDELGGLTPFLAHLYAVRPEVAAIYSDVQGEHRSAFMHWAQTHGVAEHGYDARMVTRHE